MAKTGTGHQPADMPDAAIADTVSSWLSEIAVPQASASGYAEVDLPLDSLRATQLAARVHHELGAQLPPGALLRCNSTDDFTRLILAAIRTKRSAGGSICPDPRFGPADNRLSFAEERMWFMHELAPASTAYHNAHAVRLRGPLQITVLRQSVKYVARRHEPLRTKFVRTPDGVAASVADDTTISLVEVELRRDGRTVDDGALRHLLGDFINRPFSLEDGPPLRVALFHAGDDESILLVNIHQIIGDQWSVDVFLRDLAEFYNAALQSNGPGLVPLTLTYRQHAAWHRQWFMDHRLEKDLRYWRRQLTGLEPTALAGDQPRPSHPTFTGASLRLPLAPNDIEALAGIASKHRTTLPTLLMAVLQALLHRHTGNMDVAIGVAVSGRAHPAAGALIGSFVNSLVLRTNFSQITDFASLLDDVRTNLLDALDHQEMPFEVLVQQLGLKRERHRHPLFSVLFSMRDTLIGMPRFNELTCTPVALDRRAAQFDLSLHVDTRQDPSVTFEYNSEIFTTIGIGRIAGHWQKLLRQIIAGIPHVPLTDLPLLAEEEIALVTQWSQGEQLALPARCAGDYLQRTMTGHAEAVAIRWRDQAMIYRDLAANVHALAMQLHTRGIGRGHHVGICLHRSPALIVALAAVQQSGAAWVPLDPTWPPERLRFMAIDAEIALVIVDRADDEATAGLTYELPQDRIVLSEDGRGSETQAQPASPGLTKPTGPAVADLEDPAYVMYTSGSSGRPKGVVIPHRALVNFLAAMARTPGITASDRLLAVTTPGFDIAILELLLPLTVGAQVVLASSEDLRDGKALRRLIETHHISIMQATPSTWRMLLESGWRGSDDMRALVGGEPLPMDLAAELLSRCREVWNMYGPTETTVWSSCWKVEAPIRERLSLGRPISNTSIRIVDDNLRLRPIGVPGEICIGGAGVALGYLNLDALTADRFIESPDAPGEQLYRTGDRGRFTHDGRLEFIGRMDHQVKIRGYRIEPGEIESRLTEHPELAGAVVTTVEESPGDIRLVAYVAPWNRLPDPAALRRFLGQWLPDYMMPQHFVELDAIPLLPNGKVDRASLPRAELSAVRDSRPTAPRTGLERALLDVWRDVLHADAIGVHDNFFEAGGHSMLAVRLVDRINQTTAFRCRLSMLFRSPTVATLAEALKSPEYSAGEALIPLQPLGDDPPLFCVCGIHLYQSLADHFAPDRPVYGVFIPDELQFLEHPHEQPSVRCGTPTVPELASAYLDVIRTRQPQGPYHLAGFSFGGILAFEIATQLTAQGHSVELLCLLDCNLPGEARHRLTYRGRRALQRRIRRWLAGAPATPMQIEAPVAAIAAQDLEAMKTRDDNYLQAMRAYRAAPYHGAALFIEAVEAGDDTSWGWNGIAPQIEVHTVPTTHLGLLQPPHVDQVAAVLHAQLIRNRAQ